MNRISGMINNLNMRNKYFISVILLLLIPMTLFLTVNNHYTAKDLEADTLSNSRDVFTQGVSFIESSINTVISKMVEFSGNDIAQEIIKKDSGLYKEDVWDWNVDFSRLSKLLANLKTNSSIRSFEIYMSDSLPAVFERNGIRKYISDSGVEFDKNLLAGSHGVIQWYGASYFPDSDEDCIYAVKEILDNNNFRETIGILKVGIPLKVFTDVLNSIAYFNSSSAVILGSDNKVLFDSDKSDIDISLLAGTISEYHPYSFESPVWVKAKNNKGSYLLGIQDISGANWKIALLIPYDEIFALNARNSNRAILITLLALLLVLPFAYLAAVSGTKRIRVLASQMNNIEASMLSPVKSTEGKDEIGQLTQKFNTMLTEISILLDKQYRMGIEVKNSELKALQAQINPHFLYNTLDLVHWKAVDTNNEDICSIIRLLSKFYKLSLSRGEDIVPLNYEIELIRTYVEIQNMRFENSICLVINVPEYLFSFMIPKLFLQPLVENSIIHGILEKEDATGTITISCQVSDSLFMLDISDDGVGMTQEKMDCILNATATNDVHGYGVKNINERLKLIYGNDYGLAYESALNHGTTVRIRLPA